MNNYSKKEASPHRIALIANGGLGGLLLAALLSDGQNIVGASGTVKDRVGYFEKTWDGAPQPNLIAEQAKIAFLEEKNWSEPAVIEWLRKCCANILLVAGSRHFISKSIRSAVCLAVNLHPAPLPKYPGAYPTPALMEAGETQSGVTAHIMTDQVDAGPILHFEPTPIYDGDKNSDVDRRNLAAFVRAARVIISGSWDTA